jgi:hypothetical protein
MVVLISDSFGNLRLRVPKVAKGEEARIVFTQVLEKDEKKEEKDPHLTLILKQVKEKVDDWLKSLNERIESEDVTRFEVRFLEILRGILEWVKEKVDSKIGPPEEKKEREEPSRETKQKEKELPHPVKEILGT